ncbi:MAG: STAS domain-containing protein [Gemmatimonadota bacterium]
MQRPRPPRPPGAGGPGGLAIGALPDGAGLRLAGDADLASLGRLRAALAALPASGGTIHLDLSELRFIDVAAARELMAITQSAPARRLVLHDPPPSLRRIVSLLWPGSQAEIRAGSPCQPGPPEGRRPAS